MNGYSIYKEQKSLGWTRVDLLIELYSATIRNVQEAIDAAAANDAELERQKRFHAMRLVLQLQAGLDFNYGELPQNIARLCDFVQHALGSGDSDALKSSIRVLSDLRDAFQGIREEAVRLEAENAIPPLETASHTNSRAV
ncbi:MAG: flagellar protein FliS [Planctomycetales bacterium]|nr:flagellar protein FliS [Planctomycetales bacterium]